MKINVRKKERNDCKDIAHIVTIVWPEIYRGIINDTFLDNLLNTEKQRAENSYNNFDENDNHCFVLEIDGNVVGFVNVGISDDKSYNDLGEIFAIYIYKEYHGFGFGKMLIQRGIDELKQLSCKKMIIGCLDGNPSNEFYKHLGGQFIKTRIFSNTGEDLKENVYLYDEI